MRTPWTAVVALGVVCSLLVGVLLARPATPGPSGARPTIRITVDQSRSAAVDYSQGTPTTLVSYADGTRGEASASALAGVPWTPEKPITMLIVVAQSECSINVDDVLEVTDGAATNRLAVCVWRP